MCICWKDKMGNSLHCVIRVIDQVVSHFKEEFKITIGSASQFVGFEIERDRKEGVLKLTQKNYIRRLLEKFAWTMQILLAYQLSRESF